MNVQKASFPHIRHKVYWFIYGTWKHFFFYLSSPLKMEQAVEILPCGLKRGTHLSDMVNFRGCWWHGITRIKGISKYGWYWSRFYIHPITFHSQRVLSFKMSFFQDSCARVFVYHDRVCNAVRKISCISYHLIMHTYQGWRVLDSTRFLPWYLPVNTVLGKTGFGRPKWEKLGKTQLHF